MQRLTKRTMIVVAIAIGLLSLGVLAAAPNTTSSAGTGVSGMPFAIDRLTEQFGGRAQEVIQVNGYTYVRVAAPSGERWVVSLKKHVAAGDTLSVRAIGSAQQFHSRQLQRSFDVLWFGILSVDEVTSEPTAKEPS
jgi:hypothetical protein